MLSKQYTHRLPADYDTARIRQRAAARGPLWDDTPGLAFKAFALRERGRHGAVHSAYASIYLWRDAGEAARFVADGRFQGVIDGFGRPAIELWLPLDARQGPAAAADADAPVWLVRQDADLPDSTDLAALRVAEVARNRALAAQLQTLAAVSALDVSAWRSVLLHLTRAEPAADAPGTVWEAVYVARPGLVELPGAGA